MKTDKIIVEVDEATGLIKTTTDRISAANHANADQFMGYLARLAGGETTVTPRTKTGHTHSHEHEKAKA